MSQESTTEINRRKSVEIAIADSGIEGLPPPSEAELEIWEAFIRGEIEGKRCVGSTLFSVPVP